MIRIRIKTRGINLYAAAAALAWLSAAQSYAANTNNFYLRGIASNLSNYDTVADTITPPGNTSVARSVVCTQGVSDDLLYSFFGPAIGTTTLSSGTWRFTFYASGANNNVGSETLKLYLYARTTGGTENLIFTSANTSALQHNTTVKTYTWTFTHPTATSVNATDSLVAKVYIAQCCGGTKTAGDTATIYYDASNRAANVNSPFDITPPAAVTNLAASIPGGSIGQVSLAWATPGNDGSIHALNAGADFDVQFATYVPVWADSAAQTLLVLNTSVNPNTNESATVGGLAGGALYNFGLFAVDETGNISLVSNIVTATPNRPSAPTAASPSITGAWISSAAAQWNAGGGNPAGTIYNLQASTASDFSGVVLSSATTGTSATVLNLLPGTSYFFEVDAVVGASSSTYLSLGTVTTIPAAPQPAVPTFTAVYISSVAVHWADAQNPANTRYTLAASIASDYTGNLTSATALTTSLTLTGLSGRTTYYFEVSASTNGQTSSYLALGSTTTLVPAPGVPASPFTSVYVTSAVVAWTDGGNPAGTLYTLQASTAPDFSGTIRSSSTANTSATVTGLSTSTVYSFQVDAIVTGASSAYVSLGSTSTLPSQPLSIASTYTAVGISSVTAQWGANGNGPAVTYELQASSVASFSGTVIVSSITANTSATVNGLLGTTVYYFQVRARTGVATAFTSLGSTTTLVDLAVPPGTTNPTFTNVTISSVTAQWTDGNNAPSAVYVLQASTVTNLLGVIVSSSTTPQCGKNPPGPSCGGPISATVGPLNGNTTYYFQTQATVAGGTAFTSLGSTITLPAAPAVTGSTFIMIGVSSVTLQWSANTNSTWTVYDVQASTASDFTGTLSTAVTSNLSATVGGLNINTTYYFQVRGRGNGNASVYQQFGSVMTYPAPPAAVAPAFTAAFMSSVTVQWSANGNGGGVTYALQASASSNFSNFKSSLTTSGLSATLTGLNGYTTYYFEVNASTNGYSGGYTNLGSTITLPIPPVAVPPTFTDVEISSVTGQWADPNNGPGTNYVFQCSTASNFTGILISSTTANLSATLVNLSSNTLYNCEVQAQGGNQVSTFKLVDSTQTLVPPPGTVSPTYLMVAVSSATAQWSSGGNGPGTIYNLVASDRSDFNPNLSNIYVTSATANLSATVTALFANTTTYFEVQAQASNGANSIYTNLGNTATLPPAVSPGNAFYMRNMVSDFSGFQVLMATQTPTSGADSTATGNTTGASDVLVAKFATPTLATGTLKGGTWTFNLWGNTSNTTSNSSFRVIVDIQHNDGTITQYLSSLYGPVLSGSKNSYTWTAVASAISVSTADRLGIYVYSAGASGRTQKFGYVTTLDYDSTAASSTIKMPFDIVAPDAVTTLTGTTGGVGQVNLSWTAPGNDGPYGNLGAGSFFFVDYSTYVVTFSTADTQVVDVAISGASPGSAQNTTINGLIGGTTYYFGLWTQDEANNLSVISNTTSAIAGRPATPGSLSTIFTNVYISSAAAQWSNGGNSANTIYNLSASTAPNFSGTLFSSSTANTFATVSGLAGGTSYYFQVDAVVGLSSSVYLSLGSTVTLSAHASAVTSSIAPQFGNNGKKCPILKFVVQPDPEAPNGATWSSLRVQLMDQNLNPLTNASAGAMISSMSLIANSLASYTTNFYNFNIDTEVVSNVNSFSLDGSGRQILNISTNPLTAAAINTLSLNRVYFLVIQWASNAAVQSPNTLRVTVQPNADIGMTDPKTGKTIIVDTSGSITSSSATAIAPAAAPTAYNLGSSTTAVQQAPTYSNSGGSLYAGAANGQLVSLKVSGGIAWTFNAGAAVTTSPSDNFEGTTDMVYFADAGGNIYKVQDNGTSGTQVWRRSLSGVSNIITSPVLIGTTVYIAAPDGKVHALNYADGTDMSGWNSNNTPGAGAFTATPYIDVFTTGINSLFLGASGGSMYRLAVADGSVASANSNNTANIYATANLDSGLALAGSNTNVLYWGGDDGVLRARTSSNLSVTPSGWTDFTVNPAAPIRTQPWIVRSGTKYIFIGSNNGKLYKINATTGAEVWEYATNGPILVQVPIVVPTQAGGQSVYFGSDDGNVYGLNAGTGALLSGFPVALGGAVRAGPVWNNPNAGACGSPSPCTITVGSMDGVVTTINIP